MTRHCSGLDCNSPNRHHLLHHCMHMIFEKEKNQTTKFHLRTFAIYAICTTQTKLFRY